jgi:hypothetical protein
MIIAYALVGLFWTTTAAGLLGLVWIYYTFGLAAMWGAVFLIVIIALQMERRVPVYNNGGPLGFGPTLPPSSTPRIGRVRPAVTNNNRRRAMPGRKSRAEIHGG